MSNWIHCNQCFTVPTKNYNKTRLWFTSCGHLLCAKCLKTNCPIKNGQPFDCLVCHKQNAQLMKLNRHLKPELSALFRSPNDLMHEFGVKLKQVIAFQQAHQQKLEGHLMNEAQRANEWTESMQKKMQKLSADRDKMKADLEKSKEEMNKTEGMLTTVQDELHRLDMTQQNHHRTTNHQRNIHNQPLSSFVGLATPSCSNSSFYLSSVNFSDNCSMGSNNCSVPPLLPGRIVKASIIPSSFAIHNKNHNSDTNSSFGFK